MEEHRHQHRAALVLYLDVIDEASDTLLGHLGDISALGMMFLTTQPVELNQVKNIRVEIPEGVLSLGAYTLRAAIETRWNRPNINPQWRCIGCRFVDLDSRLLPLIDEVSQKISFGENFAVVRVGSE
jgi:hypothetical protein